MKKLVQGIIDFRKNAQPSYLEKFAHLALEQRPDALFIACSDSRVVPNTFASSDPGDLFVIRNVGNLIPPCSDEGISVADESEVAAIEYAINNLDVKDIIVCGHSDCGAIQAILEGRENHPLPHLRSWLRHGEKSLELLSKNLIVNPPKEKHNHLSQLNVLQQLKHITSYKIVQEKIDQGKLNIHGWWFELTSASVYAYDGDKKQFVLINEKEAAKIAAKDLT